jgi:hypothetical protein
MAKKIMCIKLLGNNNNIGNFDILNFFKYQYLQKMLMEIL